MSLSIDLHTSKTAKLSGSHFETVRNYFSVPNPEYHILKRKGIFYATERTFIIKKNGLCDIGFIPTILKYCKFVQLPVEINKDLYKYICPSLELHDLPQLTLGLREYQEEVIQKCIKFGRGVIVVGTGGGKTLIIATLLEYFKKLNSNYRCLFMVPNLGLVNQSYSDFSEYGCTFEFSKFTGNHDLQVDSNVIIANLGILQKTKKSLDWLENLDFVLIDECVRENTKINTINGVKNIQDIKIGDYVLSYNKEKNCLEYKKVLKCYKNLKTSFSYTNYLKIQIHSDKHIYVTPNHKIYTINGVKRADELTISDTILFVNIPDILYFWYKYIHGIVFNMWRKCKLFSKAFKIST